MGFVKKGDAEIIGVVDPDKTKEDDKRKEALSAAMNEATESKKADDKKAKES